MAVQQREDLVRSAILEYISQQGEVPSLENIVECRGVEFELDGETEIELTEILEACNELDTLESMVAPEITHTIELHVTSAMRESARARNRRYPRGTPKRLD